MDVIVTWFFSVMASIWNFCVYAISLAPFLGLGMIGIPLFRRVCRYLQNLTRG